MNRYNEMINSHVYSFYLLLISKYLFTLRGGVDVQRQDFEKDFG